MYKEDLPLNNLQWFICHKTQSNPTKTTSTTSDTINTTTMTTKTTTTAAASTNSNPETGIQPEKEEGWSSDLSRR